MTTSNQLDIFLRTGKHPATLKETSAILDLLRSRILNMSTAPTKPHTPILDRLAASGGKLSLAELSPTIAAHAGALDPNTVPRMATGKIDSLAITNAQNRAKAAELAAASKAVSTKRPPGKIVINRSRYYQPD